MNADPTGKYPVAYPPELRAQVRVLIAKGRLADSLERRCPVSTAITIDLVANAFPARRSELWGEAIASERLH